MKAAQLGPLVFLGFSAAWMGAVALVWGGSSARPPRSSNPADRQPLSVAPPASVSAKVVAAVPPTPAGHDARLEHLLQRLVALLGRSDVADEDEQARVERQLLEAGEQAAAPIVAWLRREQDPARRNLLLDFLRRVPGSAAEAYFIEEARTGAQGSSRTLAMDALADRRSDAALEALDQIASSDPELPERPFIAEPRQAGDDSTQLPDEVTFTPRMKAMAALAATQDERVTPMLSKILREQPDESLRMEAARDLAQLRSDPFAVDALLTCLATERSAYVRLAALHSLEGVADDARLTPLLVRLEAHDPDRGVQALARQLLGRVAKAR